MYGGCLILNLLHVRGLRVWSFSPEALFEAQPYLIIMVLNGAACMLPVRGGNRWLALLRALKGSVLRDRPRHMHLDGGPHGWRRGVPYCCTDLIYMYC